MMRAAFDRRRQHHPPDAQRDPGRHLPRARGRVLRLPVVQGRARPRDRAAADPTTTTELAEVILDEAKVAIVPGRGVRRARLRPPVVRPRRRRPGRRHRPHRRAARRRPPTDAATRERTSAPYGSWPSPITAELVVAGAVGLGDVPGRRRRRVVGRAPARARRAGSSVVRHRAGRRDGRRVPRRASRPAPACTSTAAAPGGCTTTPSSSPTGPTSGSTGSIPTPSPAGSRRRRSR